MVLVENWPFYGVSILGNLDQENVFYDTLEREKRHSRLLLVFSVTPLLRTGITKRCPRKRHK